MNLPEMPLNFLPTGQTARVSQLLGLPEQVHRLEELGLRLGTQIEMVQAGLPCIVRFAGHKMCFRGEEALSVLVTPEAA